MRRAAEDSIERMVGPGTPTPIPDGPTHCVCGCGTELELMRRFSGYAKGHFRKPLSAPMAQSVAGAYKLLKIVKRLRAGRKETLAIIVCSCLDKTKRRIPLRVWRNKNRPECCNKCRLRHIDARGFEAEHG
jgi:hypothetical protein